MASRGEELPAKPQIPSALKAARPRTTTESLSPFTAESLPTRSGLRAEGGVTVSPEYHNKISEGDYAFPQDSEDGPDSVVIEPPQPNIAEEATKLVCGDRNNQYGPPSADYKRTAAAWSALLIHKLQPGVTIEPREAMLMMATLKICRELTNPKRDSRVDAIGYILCEDWEVTGKKPSPSSEINPPTT
jgi:hypothetical protein